MFEILTYHMDRILQSDVLGRLNLEKNKFFVVSAHREENIDLGQFQNLVNIVNQVAKTYNLRIIFSTHPRTRDRIEKENVQLHPLVESMKPLSFTEYNSLQMNALAVLSDSGTISEESSILNFPAINLREVHERPEAMEEASVILSGLSVKNAMLALRVLADQPRGEKRLFRQVSDYSMPNVSEKVVRLILSYTHFINRVVWFKQQ